MISVLGDSEMKNIYELYFCNKYHEQIREERAHLADTPTLPSILEEGQGRDSNKTRTWRQVIR